MAGNVNLKDAIQMRNALANYRDEKYLNIIAQLNTQCEEIMKEDLGSQFVRSCGRDLAGELVRGFFNTGDFHITIDQLALRILEFDYENDYDPLKESGQVHKNVYNYNDHKQTSTRLQAIAGDIQASQKKLFEKEGEKYKDDKIIRKEMAAYRSSRASRDGKLVDDYTGVAEEMLVRDNGVEYTSLQVEHTQSLASATYNEKYIKEGGIERIKQIYNSEANFTMIHERANAVKNDVRIIVNGKGETEYLVSSQILKREEKGETFTDITHTATPEQYADAVALTLEGKHTKSRKHTKPETTQVIKDAGYLDEDGNTQKHIKKTLAKEAKRSQNAESMGILQETDYVAVGKDAAGHAAASLGKIFAGQIIYYSAPPLVFELKRIMQNKPSSLEQALDDLGKAAKRIGKYIISNLKEIFAKTIFSGMKNFVKIFLDILIGIVKATVKKLLRLAKNLVLATVDAARVIVQKGSTAAQKADAVTTLFATTVTTFAVDALFDAIGAGLYIPDMLLMPLQILATIICTNLTLLILQKADLFDIRFNFKLNEIKELFATAREDFANEMELAANYSASEIDAMLAMAQNECREIYANIVEFNPFETEAREDLQKISTMFNMGIDFDKKWQEFLGAELPVAI